MKAHNGFRAAGLAVLLVASPLFVGSGGAEQQAVPSDLGAAAEFGRTVTVRKPIIPKILVFKGVYEPSEQANPKVPAPPEPLAPEGLSEALRESGTLVTKPTIPFGNYLTVSPRAPFKPNRGSLWFSYPIHVNPEQEYADFPPFSQNTDTKDDVSSYQGYAALHLNTESAKTYLVDWSVGTGLWTAGSKCWITGPGGTQTAMASIGPQHIVVTFKSWGPAAMLYLRGSVIWQLFSVTVTELP